MSTRTGRYLTVNEDLYGDAMNSAPATHTGPILVDIRAAAAMLGCSRENESFGAVALANLDVDLQAVQTAIDRQMEREERIVISQIIPTSKVKLVIEHAFEEARRSGDSYVGTEHLLLGLLLVDDGIAAHVLDELGAGLDTVRAEVDWQRKKAGPRAQPEEPKEPLSSMRTSMRPMRARRGGGPSGSLHSFERFSESSQRVLTAAQTEAERSHHSYIGTEHVLLGLLTLKEGVAADCLGTLGITLTEVRGAIESVLGRNDRIIIQQIIPTSRVKRVIELAFDEAAQMGGGAVEPEHILLALIREGKGIAAHILRDRRATLERVRAEVARLRREAGHVAGEESGADIRADQAAVVDAILREGPDTALVIEAILTDPTLIGARALAELGVTAELFADAVARLRAADDAVSDSHPDDEPAE